MEHLSAYLKHTVPFFFLLGIYQYFGPSKITIYVSMVILLLYGLATFLYELHTTSLEKHRELYTSACDCAEEYSWCPRIIVVMLHRRGWNYSNAYQGWVHASTYPEHVDWKKAAEMESLINL